MKISYFLTAIFVFVSCLVSAQNVNCNTEYLGKFKVIHEKDTIEALLLQSSLCSNNNLAIIDNKDNAGNYFKYTDGVHFEACKTSTDSLLWGYFFVDKYKFDTARFKTSIPYSNRSKKDRKYFYYSTFYLNDVQYAASFTVQNGKIIYLELMKNPLIPKDPLILVGILIRKD